MRDFLRYFPNELRKEMENLEGKDDWEEIRLRSNLPVLIRSSYKEEILNFIVSSNVLQEILERMCENSIYSYQEQICQGYVILPSGDRVGIAGNAVEIKGQITHLSYISSMNIRISKEKKGWGKEILPEILKPEEKQIRNTLLVSPPGRGKTTLLRDVIRLLSNGVPDLNWDGITISVVDERGEIAAMNQGIPQKDVGIRTDILDHVPKAIGMRMLIRSMGPQVIAADEIGSKEDVEAILYAVRSGVKGIFTAHADSLEDLQKNPELGRLLEQELFEAIFFIRSK